VSAPASTFTLNPGLRWLQLSVITVTFQHTRASL